MEENKLIVAPNPKTEPEYVMLVTGNKVYLADKAIGEPFEKIKKNEMEGIRLISRNKPCFCGSKKSFKNCCMSKYPVTIVTRKKYLPPKKELEKIVAKKEALRLKNQQTVPQPPVLDPAPQLSSPPTV